MRIPPTTTAYGLIGPEPVQKEHDHGARHAPPERGKKPQKNGHPDGLSDDEANGTAEGSDGVSFAEFLNETTDEEPLGTYDRTIAGRHVPTGSDD